VHTACDIYMDQVLFSAAHSPSLRHKQPLEQLKDESKFQKTEFVSVREKVTRTAGMFCADLYSNILIVRRLNINRQH